ncbi:MAG: hypothetical protein A3B74_02320 [Candidatus Kerfeldbacteria bacterium RIFCSPHIGHO2_02_FULL_42_14]|uniref:Uncharacterized protein n=1 Tax=Candidatus Kerfeldbacteria bacterium RIFCSPHIGHO2_02_FULL_42_14 TaxID=1798540 RepID=A0A1G2AU84_9BACT|nr:MAG: hypothetical protein A3B74_02320 [Candidatus Kerfeldbacteria bacterium RIFCSPHIGHO2_02_FULL_42_14]OGY83813.1 MAG: hypothetical protein A3I91_04465 [Candidatus Kerfeldbacteria bacterium RIFCSPLOWO2_02_FULL_42_19]OGY87120.1 MAG: hypothetical protein A3G01_04545 [Candidatus Kerfeldbacteria bacterium RIFCSPLOWO2_12_FULL_43_9]
MKHKIQMTLRNCGVVGLLIFFGYMPFCIFCTDGSERQKEAPESVVPSEVQPEVSKFPIPVSMTKAVPAANEKPTDPLPALTCDAADSMETFILQTWGAYSQRLRAVVAELDWGMRNLCPLSGEKFPTMYGCIKEGHLVLENGKVFRLRPGLFLRLAEVTEQQRYIAALEKWMEAQKETFWVPPALQQVFLNDPNWCLSKLEDLRFAPTDPFTSFRSEWGVGVVHFCPGAETPICRRPITASAEKLVPLIVEWLDKQEDFSKLAGQLYVESAPLYRWGRDTVLESPRLVKFLGHYIVLPLFEIYVQSLDLEQIKGAREQLTKISCGFDYTLSEGGREVIRKIIEKDRTRLVEIVGDWAAFGLRTIERSESGMEVVQTLANVVRQVAQIAGFTQFECKDPVKEQRDDLKLNPDALELFDAFLKEIGVAVDSQELPQVQPESEDTNLQ